MWVLELMFMKVTLYYILKWAFPRLVNAELQITERLQDIHKHGTNLTKNPIYNITGNLSS